MRAYISFFRIRFINGLQYRVAAYAGVATQFAWGFMYIMLYRAFYESNPSKMPMSLNEISNYIWLQQSLLMLFMTWFLDNEIFELIRSGNVAYELCRPLDIYKMWFAKNCATRLSKAILRCFPIILIAFFLPNGYNFTIPKSSKDFTLFIVATILGFLLVVAYCMLIYIFTFYTVSEVGIRMIMVMLADFLSGGLVPLPLLPDWITKYIYYSPFGVMQNLPFRLYSGGISVHDGLNGIVLQVFWIIVLVMFGKLLVNKAIKKVVVQGG
ncbi:ABC-2 type transport system permease protein [Clostridium cavendishii DSM 21758]|uniref:ABC-2 type transport system permease protein n=1 Tax=Clostridium cavendishii DSM 21758 TaxID=1121302 RepID=A0A1M6EXR9_9CLOT|nr:ABC-2 family transporter protein [Clostridium cavendishii]SHI90181.1 ABC-2 type transport system permease protein [Clostridium cavendishii DSM 21758]